MRKSKERLKIESLDTPILKEHCEELIRFLEENRDLIIDTKIFGGEK